MFPARLGTQTSQVAAVIMPQMLPTGPRQGLDPRRSAALPKGLRRGLGAERPVLFYTRLGSCPSLPGTTGDRSVLCIF